ncbi:MAG: nitrilase-related carbon-nitrogen hydrolase [Planctomycetota bacterium]
MRVATLEVDLRTGAVEANLKAVLAGVRAAAARGSELVALPEMWPTSFVAGATDSDYAASDQAVRRLAEVTEELPITAVGSAFGPRLEEAPGIASLPTNRAHVLRRGRVEVWYDKVHLFSPTAEHLAFRAGTEPPPVMQLPVRSGEPVKIAPVVCYDLRFPEVARAAFRGGAEVLVVVAQWPDSRAAHWKALLRGRAAELEGFVVASNRIGVDEIGRRRMRLSFGGHAAVVGPSGEDVEVADRATLRRDGDDDGALGEATKLSVQEIDLEEARALRRAVPVLKDERRELYRGWG